MEISQGKKEVKLNTVRQAEDLVKARIERVGTVMDDYDGGQVAALEGVLNDLNCMRAVINQVHKDEF